MEKRVGPSISTRVSRRDFLRFSSAGPLLLSAKGFASARVNVLPLSGPEVRSGSPQAQDTQSAIREFLNKLTCTRQEVEAFLDPKKPNWAKFDSELGYTLRDNIW